MDTGLKALITSAEFRKLNAYINKFNIFKVLSLENYEIRHSNFLAWLLDPKESHGLGDIFLKLFLEEIVEEDRFKEIHLGNLSEPTVEREFSIENKKAKKKHLIDIMIEYQVRNKNYVILIENKRQCGENNNQLDDTRDWIENDEATANGQNIRERFKDAEKSYLLLTPTPWDKDDTKGWENLTYDKINDLLDVILKCRRDSMAPYIKHVIQDYKNIIEGESPDDEIVKLKNAVLSNQKHRESLIKWIRNKDPHNKLDKEYNSILEMFNDEVIFDVFLKCLKNSSDWAKPWVTREGDIYRCHFYPENIANKEFSQNGKQQFLYFTLEYCTAQKKSLKLLLYLYPLKEETDRKAVIENMEKVLQLKVKNHNSQKYTCLYKTELNKGKEQPDWENIFKKIESLEPVKKLKTLNEDEKQSLFNHKKE